VERGFGVDVELAARLDVSPCAPRLVGDALADEPSYDD
jgi:phosphosulfolactate phosphohydrolase-like enzyme